MRIIETDSTSSVRIETNDGHKYHFVDRDDENGLTVYVDGPLTILPHATNAVTLITARRP